MNILEIIFVELAVTYPNFYNRYYNKEILVPDKA